MAGDRGEATTAGLGGVEVPVQIEHIERRVLRDRVLEAVEQALVSGTLRPGDRLKEAEIAQEAGISRGPVREALQQLVGEGILVNVPHRGTYVALWSKSDVIETYGLRALLESYAARLAMKRMTEEEKAELGSIVERMYTRAREGDAVGLSELDRRFHHRLFELSGNAPLRRILRDLWRRIGMMVNFDATTSPDLFQYADNHRMLLDALRSGKADSAEQVFREHIVSVGEALTQRMNGAPVARRKEGSAPGVYSESDGDSAGILFT
jgi:DNA-binding GntR family transcriptional regulator